MQTGSTISFAAFARRLRSLAEDPESVGAKCAQNVERKVGQGPLEDDSGSKKVLTMLHRDNVSKMQNCRDWLVQTCPNCPLLYEAKAAKVSELSKHAS